MDSPDPAEKKYPSMSPYAAFGNNPLVFTDNSGATLEVAGKVPIALQDIQSLVPKEYRSQIQLNDQNQIIFKSYDQLPASVKNYESVKLVSDLINSKNNYQYNVGDEGKAQERDGTVKGVNTNTQRNQANINFGITNLSVTPRTESDPDLAPAPGFAGSVRISEGEFETQGTSGYVNVPRANIVFHELKENLIRTEEKKPYSLTPDGKGGAHEQAGSAGKKAARQVGRSAAGATGEGTDLRFKKTTK